MKAAVFLSSHTAVTPAFVKAATAKSLISMGKPSVVHDHMRHLAWLTGEEHGLATAIPETKTIRELLVRIFSGPTLEGHIE